MERSAPFFLILFLFICIHLSFSFIPMAQLLVIASGLTVNYFTINSSLLLPFSPSSFSPSRCHHRSFRACSLTLLLPYSLHYLEREFAIYIAIYFKYLFRKEKAISSSLPPLASRNRLEPSWYKRAAKHGWPRARISSAFQTSCSQKSATTSTFPVSRD